MNRLQIPRRTSLIALDILLGCALHAKADSNKDLRQATEDTAQNIVRLNLKKIYVPDFLEASGKRTDWSAFSGAGFSKRLSEVGNNFEVLDRARVQKSHDNLGIPLADLQNRETLVKVGLTNGADGIVLGTVTQTSSNSVALAVSVREAGSGKELFGTHYELSEVQHPEEAFPAPADPS